MEIDWDLIYRNAERSREPQPFLVSQKQWENILEYAKREDISIVWDLTRNQKELTRLIKEKYGNNAEVNFG